MQVESDEGETMGELDGKVAIVTGAGVVGGIGAAGARAMAQEGARVVLADLERTAVADVPGTGSLAEVTENLREEGLDVSAFSFDLRDESTIAALIAFTLDTYGRLDVIDNNAAATHLVPNDVDILTADPALWAETMAVNLTGAMLMCKHGIPAMVRTGGGSVVNHSSGKGAAGDLDNPAYAASKAGLHSLTQMIATIHGHEGVRANTILTGLIGTALMKQVVPKTLKDTIEAECLVPRLGEPEDIAQLVVFLASDRSSYITAQVIGCDGGILAHQPFYSARRAAEDGQPLQAIGEGT
jgi:NAD(P)-dependent dehydrogenase (short-subunit alcohol dehydrogenase family)